MFTTDLIYAMPTIFLGVIFILVAMLEYPVFTIGVLGAVILGLAYGGGSAIFLGGFSGAVLGWILSRSREPDPVDEFHKRYLGI
jgi:hypothetical protein